MDRKFQRQIRAKRVRSKIEGRLRLSVFKSNRHLYAQIIDDVKGHTLVAASDAAPATIALAKKIGALLAQKAKEVKIKKVAFDRGGFKYHGQIKALAEAARAGGLQF